MERDLVSSINRRDASLLADRIVYMDELWYDGELTAKLTDDTPATRSDRAWLIGQIAAGTPGLHFDGCPADADWDGFFQHIRAEILARRAPRTPSVRVAETPCGMVV
jgi:hypothetical protein